MTTPVTTITVTANTDQVTLVNVFTVAPERQMALVEALDEATRQIFTTVPGFISANLHTSLDGTRVINYAQWASEKHYKDALQRADVREHITKAAAGADKWDPTLAQVQSIHHPGRA
ncbi:antibiotic biosynthesis monooxygenase [Streptomyces sp. NBC_00878]|uniref:antibiotic biosynthesis monooxygenase family protein n=1 Tax=Streptomyces sp. NBC_00878 TaxID=2975854 RepID=UPI0022513618|nr:antibiotic biosynthesis monooxygenase family protein [Streptomyces sp. NBC_00878]MCX4904665.1 antibiotic biosynthesis monooxygenase [Streptomyces sp. NBC_00878]